MTQRERQKMGRAAVPRTGARAKRTGSSRSKAKNGKATSLEELERERLELRAKLAAAEARIAALESQRVDALNRIDWVIDSIQNVLERP